MSTFEFGGINTSTPKKLVSKISEDVLIYEHDSGDKGNVLFLMDLWPTATELRSFRIWIERLLPGFTYRILLGSKVRATEEDMSRAGGFARFYKRSGVNIREYSYDKQCVVSVGRALYSTTHSSDINTSCFYDFVFNQTFFYAPLAESFVFPIDGLEDLFHGDKPTRKGAIPHTPQDSFRAHFAELQLKTLRDNYNKLCEGIMEPRLKLHNLSSKEELAELYKKYKDAEYVAWDLETSGFSFVEDRIGCITMAFSPTEGYFIPWDLVDIEELNTFLGSKIKIGQNLKFDIEFVTRALAEKRGWPEFLENNNFVVDIDTLQLAQRLMETRSNGLKSLAYYYSPFGGYDEPLEDYKDRYNPESYLDIPLPILAEYATKDAIVTFWVWKAMEEQTEKLDQRFPPLTQGSWSMRDYFEKQVMPSLRAFPEIESKGIIVDMELWDKNSDIVEGKIKELYARLHKELKIEEYAAATSRTSFQSEDIDWLDEDDTEENSKNVTSGKKLGELIEWLGWPCMGRSKKGFFLTGDAPLALWKKAGFTAASTLQELRAWRTLQRTFLGKKGTDIGWRQHVVYHKEDNTWRLHPSYQVMSAESGRNKCSRPNWQQIPAHGDTADLVKSLISTPSPGQAHLATLDYSSLQIRLAAIDSEDKTLFRAYREDADADLHSITGYNVFAQGRQFEVEEVEVEDERGNIHVFLAEQKINVIDEGGASVERLAKDLKETDRIPV